MKKFLYSTIILSLPILIILVMINYLGDAAKLFNNDYEKEIANIIAHGKYVTNLDNYDERILQKELIENELLQPNLVIIGSSRTMLISKEFLSDSLLFNNSVSGASIEDIVSIYQLYKTNNKLPNKIIIGIDPWIFNENNEKERWKSISNYYYSFINSEHIESVSYYKYKELFSLSYFQSSLKMIPHYFSGKLIPQSTSEKNNYLNTKLTDGSIIYAEIYRNASPEEIKNKIKTYLNGSIYGIEYFTQVSKKNWNDFGKLIDDIEKNGIEIEFFLSPYAPLVYNKIEKDYPLVMKIERIINDFASSKNIKIYGSYSPFILGMDESYFYDAIHCKEIAIEKIISMKK